MDLFRTEGFLSNMEAYDEQRRQMGMATDAANRAAPVEASELDDRSSRFSTSSLREALPSLPSPLSSPVPASQPQGHRKRLGRLGKLKNFLSGKSSDSERASRQERSTQRAKPQTDHAGNRDRVALNRMENQPPRDDTRVVNFQRPDWALASSYQASDRTQPASPSSLSFFRGVSRLPAPEDAWESRSPLQPDSPSSSSVFQGASPGWGTFANTQGHGAFSHWSPAPHDGGESRIHGHSAIPLSWSFYHDVSSAWNAFTAPEGAGESMHWPGAESSGMAQDMTPRFTTAPPTGDFYYSRPGELTDGDRQRYRQLEAVHSDLFSSPEIRPAASARRLRLGNVRDVDLTESEVINATTGEFASIGTKALSTCIAVCVRGKNSRGDDLLGLHHYDGMASAEQALAHLESQMRRQGSSHNHFYLVGGMILPEESGLGSYEAESDLLSLRGRYDIRGARLHVLEGEYDSKGEENMLNVVVTPNDIFYSRKDLYDND